MRSTFKVLFYVKKGSEKPNGNLPLMCRITIIKAGVSRRWLSLCSSQNALTTLPPL